MLVKHKYLIISAYLSLELFYISTYIFLPSYFLETDLGKLGSGSMQDFVKIIINSIPLIFFYCKSLLLGCFQVSLAYF